MINLDLGPSLPEPTRLASSWSLAERCAIAGSFYNAFYTAVTFSMLRRFGHDRTYNVHEKLLRHHQAGYFLEGLRKLGLDRESSDAVRCAKYHCISNALGGVRTRYAVESDRKAWLFYYPQACDNAWPGPAGAAHTRNSMISDYLGWHGNNGNLLGNPGLVYVATHFMADGDPFEGGYFLDTGAPVVDGTHVRFAEREVVPADVIFEGEDLDPGEWPEPRRAKAFRNYAVTWAADRAWTSIRYFGAEGADAVAHGLCFTVFSWLPRLARAFELDGPDRVERLIAGLHDIGGMSAETVAGEVRLERTLLDLSATPFSDEDQVLAQNALSKAWSSIAGHLEAGSESAFSAQTRTIQVIRKAAGVTAASL